jgi:cyclopropane-fatty-acyl-phospholipid synthase
MASIQTIQALTDLLATADIKFNGQNDWDIQVKHESFYDRLIKDGSLGLGEAYMDGWWECKDIEGLVFRLLSNNIHTKYNQVINKGNFFDILKIKFNPNVDPYEIGRKHYDNGNDLYEAMLGPTMTYSCGYWKDAKTLDEAQTAKFELICRKLHLQEGMTVIDIGCGWGGLLAYMVDKYQVIATGLTVSAEQKKFIDEKYQNRNITVHLMDYQEFCQVTTEQYDRVVSVGMFEHVKKHDYTNYMKCSHSLLKDNGYFLLHTIGNKQNSNINDDWLGTYIFPNGEIPAASQLIGASESIFILEDWQNFGLYYETTLLAWEKNFEQSWPSLKDKYGDRFYRDTTY